jgi:hypothetical protein
LVPVSVGRPASVGVGVPELLASDGVADGVVLAFATGPRSNWILY